jgi:hypothetical protein
MLEPELTLLFTRRLTALGRVALDRLIAERR